jgi:predicted RNase H-related nuclease YkuK (DUF458 family)
MNWYRNDKEIKEPINEYLSKLFDEEMDKGYFLKVAVGTDSAKCGMKTYQFATVIMITTCEDLGGGVIVGRGAMVIHRKSKQSFYKTKAENVNERMLVEVTKSIEAAYELSDVMDQYGFKMSIHADINPDPKEGSNSAMNQAVGYILGMGYDFEVKPNSLAAMSSADKLC